MNDAKKENGERALQRMLSVRISSGAAAVSQRSTDNSQLDFIASTSALDRYREIIEPSGWKLESYRSNPVFQNSHRYGDVLFTLGKALVSEVRDLEDGRKGLFLRVEFATEINPVARIAYGLYRGGFLNAVSVGFTPLRWEDGNERTEWRCRYLEQELLEVSAVAIPANPEALALGLKSGAINKDDLSESLETMRLALAGAPGSTQLFNHARELRRIMRGH